MRRTANERQCTLREWRMRFEMDASLEPGRFRKGRTAQGCPRRCAHCRAIKLQPTRQERLSEIAEAEWLRDDPVET